MRGKTSNILGERFGKLTVVEHVGSDKHHCSIWKCDCDCGNSIITTARSLLSGDTRSCGCIKSTNLMGKQFGRLLVLGDSGKRRGRRIQWDCLCECGNHVTVDGHSLKSGHTQSCGCLMRETVSDIFTKHGGSKNRLYTVWCGMVQRCTNPNHDAFHNYGGRGISICSEWRDSYEAFAEWAYLNGYDETAPYGKCTIDRIDNDGDYCPANCRWVDMKAQSNNRRKEK